MPIGETEGWKNLSSTVDQFSNEFNLKNIFKDLILGKF